MLTAEQLARWTGREERSRKRRASQRSPVSIPNEVDQQDERTLGSRIRKDGEGFLGFLEVRANLLHGGRDGAVAFHHLLHLCQVGFSNRLFCGQLPDPTPID